MDESAVYGAIGEEGFARLAAAFYRRIPQDNILGPMYPADDLEAAEHRLRDFLVGRFGGPPRYIEERGHPRLRMRHMPFPVTPAARDRWVTLMAQSITEAQLPQDAGQLLFEFFGAMATFLINKGESTA
ncbi:MAG: globin [Acidobacteriota bacterium]